MDNGNSIPFKGEKPIPSQGASLEMGLSERVGFEAESPDTLGMGRNEDNGKPTGPEKTGVEGGMRWG